MWFCLFFALCVGVSWQFVRGGLVDVVSLASTLLLDVLFLFGSNSVCYENKNKHELFSMMRPGT